MVAHPFLRATGVARSGPSRWRAVLDGDWFGSAAPHGGHLAASLLRAAAAEVDDPGLSGRSLTVHFLAPGEPGEFEIETRVLRAGRNLSVIEARGVQKGSTLAVALVALGRPRRGPAVRDAQAPALAEPHMLEGPSERVAAWLPPVFAHYELRFGFGTPGSGDVPRAGGWVRPLEPLTPDDAVITALADIWVPSVFVALDAPILTTTTEMTVNYLASPAGVPADAWYAAVFRTPFAGDGYFREDGEIWSQDGRLLACTSQLGAFLTGRRPPPPYGTARTHEPG